jgi:outer membrane cobalamin receptor
VTRLEERAGEAPAAVTVLTRDDIADSPALTLDDVLRQVPGFSLFRRTSSVVGHPTTQGVSLRGIGPSGTSRALVLLDGIPVNDPFGGWVYWDRIPLQSVQQVEVVRGGGASVWGNYALGGVVNVITRRPTERAAFFEGSYGNRNTLSLDLLVTEVHGPFRLSLEGSHFRTDGYPVVKASDRGRIDIDADSEHSTFNGLAELALSQDASLYIRGIHYDEDRGNGTPLQNNDTHSGTFAGGGRVRTPDGSEWSFNVSADFQKFRSTFSTQAPDRNSETLALDQRVPTTAVGASLQWSRRFDRHLLLAGADFRWVDGETDERVFNAGVFLRNRDAGGEQVPRTTGRRTTAFAGTRRRRPACPRARRSATPTG